MTNPAPSRAPARHDWQFEWPIIVVATAAVAVATWLATDRSLASLVLTLISVGGAGLATWLVRDHP